MNFAKFNKKQLFPNAPQNIEEYKTLEQLFTESNGDEEKVYCIRAAYINTKSNFAPESPTILVDEAYVNIPQHQLADIKAMLSDAAAISAINMGQAGFKIESYYQERYRKECYKAVWCNYLPLDDSVYSEDEEDVIN